jgi:hypothetical protein
MAQPAPATFMDQAKEVRCPDPGSSAALGILNGLAIAAAFWTIFGYAIYAVVS